MGFPIGNLLNIRYFLFAGWQTCKLFENDLMATHKRSKETNRGFDLLSILIFLRYSIEREVI